MKVLTCAVLLLVSASILVQRSQGRSATPCSQVVSYEDDKKLSNRWHGTVVFNAVGHRPFELTITLDRKANLLGAWFGPIISKDNRNFILQHPAPENGGGSNRISVRFFVNFRHPFPVPRVMSIRVDKNTLCNSVGTDSGFYNSSPEPIILTRPTARPQNLVSRPTVTSVTRRTERPATFSNPSRPYKSPLVSGTTPNPWVVTTASTTTKRVTTGSFYKDSSPAHITYTEECGTINVQSASHVPLLVNPQSSTYHGEWPWHVAIYNTAHGDQSYKCGGTLISRRVIITAGHCVTNPSSKREWSPDQLIVYLGKHSLPYGWTALDGVQTFTPDRIIRHPTYDHGNKAGDIAMILLPRDAEITSYVRVICLWSQQETDIKSLEGQLGTVVGWGIDLTHRISFQLMRANLQVRSYDECVRSNDKLTQLLVDKTYCAGWRNGTSACNGDSGGGMVFQRKNRWFLRGVVSRAVRLNGFCNNDHYTVFVDVAQYRDWIEQNQPGNQVTRTSSSVPNRRRQRK